MSSRRRRIKTKWEENNNGKAVDKMYVKEWLHHNAKRSTKIKFGPDEAFHLMNRKGEKMRSVSVKVSLIVSHQVKIKLIYIII